ncbi:type II toxin-antitoxin system Phd/YefM family antitoxin [Methylocystis parvus]|uniref:Antitoxin n=1 Tax=Methylocystis parvus TaxID=134 RepID=A0A6B8M5N1_9HYPH|nr:type II toxin-antitoxin system Phd/YefM family antitoxin [Methylocystis parvus]QGM96643.1 type II toxin-antitoxin system prevent-host-death family antitoxin [Methylocystis parvus]WBJ99499.1 type II toxin-antitoxin system Phd/YefM family antitoxin [Methylocystis parvus OBBP]
MLVNIHTAKSQLSKLIEAALSGEDVVIAKGDKPVVRLVAIERGGFKIGFLRDRGLGAGPDFLEPMPEEELQLWEGAASPSKP